MVGLSRPELPLSSAAVAEPTRHDPDAGGHFGVFGGRYVAEALMAVIEEVTAAYEKERVNPDFLETLDELQEFVRGRLADYKRPRWVEFVAELPKTGTGKTQRFKLREQTEMAYC